MHTQLSKVCNGCLLMQETKGRQSSGRKVVEVGLCMINCPCKINHEK